MEKYKHLNLEEREKLFAWKEQNLSLRKIAPRLRRSHTTLSGELRRNVEYLFPYVPCQAQRKAEERLHQQ